MTGAGVCEVVGSGTDEAREVEVGVVMVLVVRHHGAP
jgi:hypothetical protein